MYTNKSRFNHIRFKTLRHTISIPFIWALIVPLVILDVFTELYHRIGFPLYGMKYIKRSDYVLIDRQKLSYLKWYAKIFCMYCGYANGFLRYASAIAAASEEYWCNVMHHGKIGFKSPEHHKEFIEYGDKKEYIEFKEEASEE